jgi:hypothetical protein
MKTNVYCQDWKLGLFKGTKILSWPLGTKHCSVILPQLQKRSLKSTDSCQDLARSCQHLNFHFLAKQNISTDKKNSAEKPAQLASSFSLFFSAAS